MCCDCLQGNVRHLSSRLLDHGALFPQRSGDLAAGSTALLSTKQKSLVCFSKGHERPALFAVGTLRERAASCLECFLCNYWLLGILCVFCSVSLWFNPCMNCFSYLGFLPGFLLHVAGTRLMRNVENANSDQELQILTLVLSEKQVVTGYSRHTAVGRSLHICSCVNSNISFFPNWKIVTIDFYVGKWKKSNPLIHTLLFFIFFW